MYKRQLGGPVPGTPQDRYATCSDRPGICVLKDATRFLEATPSSLRSRHLSPFQNDAIDRIEISYPGQPTPSVVARRKGGSDWESPGRDSSVAGERVDAWLSGLKELPVSDFQPATADRLAATGLSRPTVIRLIAHLSENTAEEGAGDMVLAEFSLGEPEGGSTAVLEKGSPDLMTVPSARIRPLMEECSSWITPSAPPPAK